MPLSEREMELMRLIQDAIPVTLKKENEEKAKKEYEEYKLNNKFKKIAELNPLTVYLIISDLKGEEQTNFIRENIDYLRKNDENVFIYNMMAPHSLSYYLNYESLREICKLDKGIFGKILSGQVENIIEGFSNEEIFSFFEEFSEEIKESMNDYVFVNFYHHSRQELFCNFRIDRSFDKENWKEISFLSEKECGKLTVVILDKYKERISRLNDFSFLNFFSHTLNYEREDLRVSSFLEGNKDRLNNIFKTINVDKLFSCFEDVGVSLHKKIFNDFGDVILNRGDLKELFVVVDPHLLCEYYKKNKKWFKDIEIEDWLKIPYLEDDLKEVLDDYVGCDFKKLFESKKWCNDEGVKYLESKYRESIKKENLYNIDEMESIYSSEYMNNLEIIKRKIYRKEIVKNSDIYINHFKLFVESLIKNNNIVEVNSDNIRELERYFFLVVKGLSLNDVREIKSINEIALFNRVGNGYNIDENEFSLEQIQKFNVKEHKLLLGVGWMNGNRDFIKNYKTLTLKLMLLVGYERARYILSLDKNITTLEHLVGNVNVKNVKMDEFGDPVLNKKIINLLFKDLERNRIDLMINNKESELYKYFPRIFNEWDLIEVNKKSNNLKTIIEFLKSDDICVSAKYYRLKGLFKYIGCNRGIVNETLECHDEMIKRVGSTIPRVKGQCGDYTYEVLKLKDMEGLTVGNRTDCCFTVKGNAYSSLKHALTNKNGRILVIKKDGELVGHSWLWRNGNVLCLDNIEVAKGIKEVDFLDVYLKFSDEIVEKSSCYEDVETCLKNVTIGRTYFDKKVIGLEKYKKFVLRNPDNLLEENVVIVDKLPSVGIENIYSDAREKQVLIKGNGDFKYYDNECYYEDEREDVLFYSSSETINKEKICDVVNCLRYIKCEEKGNIKDFELIDIEDYQRIWCNEDWYILIDKKGKEEKYTLRYDERVKDEMNCILNNQIKKVVKR